jgi:hypothetical protein
MMDDVLSSAASTLPCDDADEDIALPGVSGDCGGGVRKFVGGETTGPSRLRVGTAFR